MKKNKIFSFVLSLATICNFTLAQAQDNTQNSLQDYLASIMDAPNSADSYERAQRETQILQRQQYQLIKNPLLGF